MYHFTADHQPEPVRLSYRALIPGHIRQYLKDFQLDAIRFMHTFLAKSEFCVYNDESGLGKQASVVVLLDAACSSRKTLIVVQNDDRCLNGWEFHFNILTKTNISIIKNEKDTTDSPHNIYIAKWSTLRTIDDLSKLKFDFIILDNRGQMLNNTFCTSMLLKHYERKINILISSVDITSDLKLLHNVLRLGGRLDPQFINFKVFEEKFKLPDAKELAYKRVDLEEYFCKRERLADYCKGFRLRRYCHQFETQLPLVKEDRYRINLNIWSEKQNAANSENSSVEFVNHQNRENEQIKDTQELFEEYCRQKRKQHLQFQQEEEQRLQAKEREMLKSLEAQQEVVYNVDEEVALINDSPPIGTGKSLASGDNSDEVVLMSPLLVESDSDPDEVPKICNDPITDIVDLSSEEKHCERNTDNGTFNCINKQSDNKSKKFNIENKVSRNKKRKTRTELDKLQEDIVDRLKVKESSKRISDFAIVKNNLRSANKRLKPNLPDKKTHTVPSKSASSIDKTPKSHNNNIAIKRDSKRGYKSPKNRILLKKEKNSKDNINDLVSVSEINIKNNCTIRKDIHSFDEKNTSLLHLIPNSTSVKKRQKSSTTNSRKNYTDKTTTFSAAKKSKSGQNFENISNKTTKKEILEKIPQTKKKNCNKNNEEVRLNRKLLTSPAGIHFKQTRSMERLTRSSGSSSKYIKKNLSLQIDKIKKFNKRRKALNKIRKCTERNKNTDLDNKNENKNEIVVKEKTENINKNTQTSIISHRSSQDYESLQCAQRLSDEVIFNNGNERIKEFLVPPTPVAAGKNSLVPSSLTSSEKFFTQSDIIFIPPSFPYNSTTAKKHDQVISISSSDNENSTSQSSSINISMTSRRTRALKPKRNQHQIISDTKKVSNFSDVLGQQHTRSSVKSPDLFSNCSDLIQLHCTQQNLDGEEPNTPFEGFKIFGSEVKQLQQHYASNQNNNSNKHNLNQSKSYQEQRSCLDILEKMFEPTNKKTKQVNNEKSGTSSKKVGRPPALTKKQKTQTQILPSHPIEAIVEARQQQELQKRQRYTVSSSSGMQDDDIFEITNNGTFGSVMRLHSNGDISPVQHNQKGNAKQHNKITNYLIGNSTQNGSQEEPIPNSTGNINGESGTPSKKHEHMVTAQNVNGKKSPKGKCNTTQTTKLTKWFTKPSELNYHESNVKAKSPNSQKTPTKQIPVNQKVDCNITISQQLSPPPVCKRIVKRRRLDLSFNK